MRVTKELIATIQNEFANRCNDWEFDGRKIINAYQKGEDGLVLELGGEEELTIRVEANGKEKRCASCGKTKSGWPYWWRNIGGSGPVLYGCHDCVVNKERGQGDGEAGGSEGDDARH